MNPTEEPEATSSHRADRKQSLMKATFDIIASKGFEGLRTQAVADGAGVNIGTLHYYYPTKEALIGAVAEYIGEIFLSTRGPAVPATGRRGLDRLRQEFADTAFYLAEHRDLMTVIAELQLRALRDPVVKQHVDMLMFYWRQHLAELVKLGLEDGSFRSDIDPDQATAALMALFSGLSSADPDDVDAVRQAVEQWLVQE